MSLIDRVKERIAELDARSAEIGAELDAISDNPEARGLDDDAALAKIAELRSDGEKVRADRTAAQEQLAALEADEARRAAAAEIRKPAYDQVARVTSEPRQYRADNAYENSFFVDAYNAQFRMDRQAQSRIERHMRETEVELRDVTSSTFNGLIPPRYLLDQAATLARAMRPFADAVPGYQLPPDGMTLYATRVTTGTAAAVQASENTAANEQDMVTTDISIPVVTILGQQDLSRQAIERGAVTDQLVFNDLVADYQTKLDAQLISGSGSSGQHRGILAVASIDLQTFTGTTVASFYSKLNGSLSAIASGRYAPATVIVMHPRRWHWLLAASDTSNRPLVVPAPAQEFNAPGTGATGYGVVGTLAGLPVIADANVPNGLGTSTNEDRVIVTRLSDHALWEAGIMTFAFDQALNPPASIRLAVAGYSAFTAGRYPAATSVVTGTGLVTPTF